MQTYQTRRKVPGQAVAPGQQAAPSKSEMLHMSGAGAPQPMSPQLREKFEPGFGADFSNIRISRGHIPDEMGVQAVAQGTDILLDERAGMDVLGHELAHVVQQAQGRVDGGYPVVENAALEQEADVMGQRVASGLTAQAGPQNGFGGEMMSIAPMSSASAPAQCKSREEKAREKMQISQPTLLQPGTAGYQNSALDTEHLGAARKEGSSSEDVALTQMLNAMHDSEYLAKVTQSTGSTPEEIKAQMGSLVGQNYAKGAKRRGIERGGDAINGAFRENALFNKNLNLLLRGDFTDLAGQMAQNAQSGTLEQRASAAGKRSQAGEMDQNTVDSQFDLATDALTQSAPAMSVVDGFFREMRQTGANVSDDLMEEKMSSELFLRGVNPELFNLAAKQTGEEKTKTLALSRGLQTEAGTAGKAEHRNFLRGRATPQAAAAPFETEISDPVYEEVEEPNSTQEMQERVEAAEINRAIPRELFDEMTDERGHLLDVATIAARADAASPSYLGMRGMFNEDRAAMEASDPSYLGMRGMFNEDRAANAARTPNYSGVKALFTEPKPSPPAAETSYAEMRTLFNPSLDPGALEARREARAAYQESSEASFSGNMRSLFCENRPKSVAEELGLPEAPGEKYVTGLTELEDLYEVEQEEAAAARAYAGESEQMFSGNKASGELERMMNLSDEEENELMKDVQILDPANDPPPLPGAGSGPRGQKKESLVAVLEINPRAHSVIRQEQKNACLFRQAFFSTQRDYGREERGVSSAVTTRTFLSWLLPSSFFCSRFQACHRLSPRRHCLCRIHTENRPPEHSDPKAGKCKLMDPCPGSEGRQTIRLLQ